MNFQLNEEQQNLWDLLGRIGQERMRPTAFEGRFEPDQIPVENMKLLGSLGILSICMPESVGGAARPYIDGVLAIERISQACPRTATFVLMVIAGPPMFLAKWGTEDQKARYIPKALAGEEHWAISLSEPEAGTDLASLKTSARVEGDRCVINGHKIFCSKANNSDHFLVFVRFRAGSSGIGAVIVNRDTPGFTIGKSHHHMSGQSWSELYFDNAESPVADIVFDGNAFRKLMATYSLERCAGAVTTLGIARIAFDMAIQHARERRQFGRPIAEFQMTQARLADMYMRLEGARLLLYRAVLDFEGSAEVKLNSSIAMVNASEAAAYVCEEAMNVFGGSGMSQDLPLEWLYRRARVYWAAGGTSDIHRSMIASELLNMPFDHRGGARSQ